jgi:hypothetical protein
MVKTNAILGGVCSAIFEFYKTRPGFPLTPPQEAQVIAALRECERYVAKMHCLAAGAADMLDDSWKANGMEPPERRFKIVTEFDPTPGQPNARHLPEERPNGHAPKPAKRATPNVGAS